ncbi:MAG: hypothetical protein ACSHYB_06225 [Roseibacillus sp.]
MKLTALLTLLSLGSLSAEVRDWTSADGTRTFSGEVTAYEKATNTVKVSVDGQEVSFTTDKLSEEDREYLSTWTKEAKPKIETDVAQTIPLLLKSDKLHRLSEKKFVETELEKTPQYFLLYYSASW